MDYLFKLLLISLNLIFYFDRSTSYTANGGIYTSAPDLIEQSDGNGFVGSSSIYGVGQTKTNLNQQSTYPFYGQYSPGINFAPNAGYPPMNIQGYLPNTINYAQPDRGLLRNAISSLLSKISLLFG
ncbi:hypothetical protein DdX_03712 [Ditylenchus destructor]|uniref:Uncharacterized protein n=1 Tax=Ditylenchus destructor TaxID=166010 RepID=A0AAD4RB92_9BILA|nr:hypothetical protein DdX_03712 [Ditylenchus destructor]